MATVTILMGSKSDMDVMKKAADFLIEHDIDVDMHVASAHRNPDKVHSICKEVEAHGDVVITGAGMAAHLGGVVASLVTKPVIAVPVGSSSLGGLDALLATVQMPSGIPVATVAINGSKNAAILAMEILALKDSAIKEKLIAFRKTF
tara:strand:- start:150 stop:590 length:441 start_codon:yes stop_codon:yes gene_type:complete